MGLNEILLFIAALAPAIALGIYIYIKDRTEKEPIGLLMLLLLGGALTIIPILIVSIPVDAVHALFFGAEAPDIMSNTLGYYVFHATDAMTVGLTEEGFKWLALVIITKRNKNFNSLFDGIIYAVFVSIGFAAPENVLYCFTNPDGWSVAIMRAVLSVPGHVFFGVMMGYFYSLWHMNSKAKAVEDVYKQRGLVANDAKSFPVIKFALLSYIVPMFAHTFYDFGLFTGTIIGAFATLAFVVFMYIYCFAKVRKMSKLDVSDSSYVKLLLVRKYPQLERYIYEQEYNALEAAQVDAVSV